MCTCTLVYLNRCGLNLTKLPCKSNVMHIHRSTHKNTSSINISPITNNIILYRENAKKKNGKLLKLVSNQSFCCFILFYFLPIFNRKDNTCSRVQKCETVESVSSRKILHNEMRFYLVHRLSVCQYFTLNFILFYFSLSLFILLFCCFFILLQIDADESFDNVEYMIDKYCLN